MTRISATNNRIEQSMARAASRRGDAKSNRRWKRPNSPRHKNLTFTCGLLLVAVTFLQMVEAYPALMMLAAPSGSALSQSSSFAQFTDAREPSAAESKPLSARKRAFDRLDVSPFDFEALSKRFNDDDDLFYGRRRRAFDRLDDNAFMGLMNRKRRAFDRLEDGPFMLGKRAINYDELAGIRRVVKRPFDRLDGSAFGIAKRTPLAQRLSISELLRRLEAEENQDES